MSTFERLNQQSLETRNLAVDGRVSASLHVWLTAVQLGTLLPPSGARWPRRRTHLFSRSNNPHSFDRSARSNPLPVVIDSSSPPTQYRTRAAASAMAAAASSYFAGPAIMPSQRAAAAPDNSAAASTPSPAKVCDPRPRDPSSHLPTPPNPNPFLVPIHSPATPASPDARPPPSATSPAPLPPQPRPSMLPAAGTPSSPSTASTPPT
jgi:hypothetical protein